MKDFVRKYWWVLVLVLIVCASGLVRLQSQGYPVTERWAWQSVEANVKGNLASDLLSQYPNLPEWKVREKVDERYGELLVNYSDVFEVEVGKVSDFYLSRLVDDKGNMYAPDIDTYYWLRQSQNILDNGHVGDELRGGVVWDDHMNFPFGVPTSGLFNSYFGVGLYKIMHFFDRGVTLMGAMMWIPVIVGSLSVVPVFFLCRRFGGVFGGVVGAFFVAVLPYAVSRSSFGLFDTDIYNLTMPLMVLWVFVEFLDSLGEGWRSWFWGVFAGLFVGLYSAMWANWWFTFFLILGACVCWIVFALFFRRGRVNELKNFVGGTFFYFLSSAVFVSVFSGFRVFVGSFIKPVTYLGLKDTVNENLFPNVFTTVAELNPGSLDVMMSVLGGVFLFFFVFAGLIVLFFNCFREREDDLFVWFMFLCMLWFFGAVYITTTGMRFMILLSCIYVVLFGVVVGRLFGACVGWAKSIGIGRVWVGVVFVVVFGLVLASQASISVSIARGSAPLMNDAWWDGLNWVKDNTDERSVMVSWWDYGHWFKAVADRPVVFDGASQNSPLAYWVGKMFLTSDERESVGILRMVTCGNSRGYEVLDAELGDTVRSVGLIDEILVLDRVEAEGVLKGEGVKNVSGVLEWTHCVPESSSVVVASSDMVGKAGVWAYFGGWDFEKAKEGYPADMISRRLNYQDTPGELESSVFTRMYFAEGETLNIYRLVHNETDFGGGKIMFYEVVWS